MEVTYIVVSLLVGWCGTPWPIRWPRIWPPMPEPKPEPPPCPVCGNVVSAVGGVLGGFLITQLVPNETSLVVVAIGAFIGSRIASDIYGAFKGGVIIDG